VRGGLTRIVKLEANHDDDVRPDSEPDTRKYSTIRAKINSAQLYIPGMLFLAALYGYSITFATLHTICVKCTNNPIP
jgi:hypothetical protein